MSYKPSIKRNLVFKLLYQILAMVIPLVTAPYVSRVLGADGVGIYSYTQSYAMYFIYFALLGTGTYGTREIARCRDDRKEYSKTFWEIELLTVVTSGVCLFFWCFLILFYRDYRIYFIALTPSILAQTFDIEWFYTGHERISYTVLWNAVCKVAGLVCIFLFVREKSDLLLYIFLNSFILMLGNISMWIYLPGMLERVNFRELSIRRHFKETLVYFVPTVATSIYTILDKMLIGIITSDSFENGYYEQATKIINIVKPLCFTALNSMMTARMSYLCSVDNQEEIKKRIELSIDTIMFMAVGSMFGIIAVSETFVPLFFGPGYEPVVNLLRVMSVILVIIGISNCLGSHYFVPVGKIKLSTYFLILGSVVNLCLNLLLIPYIDAMGAAIGSIGAESAITILYVHFDGGYLKWKDIFFRIYKKIIAGIVMLIVVWFVDDIVKLSSLLELVLQVVTGAGVYFAVLLVLRDASALYFLNVLLAKLKLRGV